MIATLAQKAKLVNPLARFVTREAIALLLNIKPEQIDRIDCWRYVIHVVGKGISRFVSYGDIPPILGVEVPNSQDFWRWRKRWRKNYFKAPQFWAEFYQRKFKQATSLEELRGWGELIAMIKFSFPETTIQLLRTVYLNCQSIL